MPLLFVNVSSRLRTTICAALCPLMISSPAFAVTHQSMIPTTVVVAQLDRAQAQADVEDFLSREDVKKALIERGVSATEVSSRLATLSEKELRDLAGQMDQARAGGDILIAILIVVLIIFLIKRI
jgi:hypothetical protein